MLAKLSKLVSGLSNKNASSILCSPKSALFSHVLYFFLPLFTVNNNSHQCQSSVSQSERFTEVQKLRALSSCHGADWPDWLFH